jgi:hypothetical protein
MPETTSNAANTRRGRAGRRKAHGGRAAQESPGVRRSPCRPVAQEYNRRAGDLSNKQQHMRNLNPDSLAQTGTKNGVIVTTNPVQADRARQDSLPPIGMRIAENRHCGLVELYRDVAPIHSLLWYRFAALQIR